jgi:hypothetical protein
VLLFLPYSALDKVLNFSAAIGQAGQATASRPLAKALILAGLFVAADRLAVNLAENEAADRISSAQGLSGVDSASVSIHGFPFLTQVAGRELDDVDVRLRGMTADAGDQQITVTGVDAHLRDVLLGEDYSSATAGEATGEARITYADLNKIAPKGVHVSYAGADRAAKNQVKLTVGLEVFGRKFELPEPIYSTVRVTGRNQLELRAAHLPGADIPGIDTQLRERIDFGSDVGGLPEGLALDGADVTPKGLAFHLSGHDVALTG